MLDYDLRIAEVWPEFARHGKDTVTLRHALTQSAGVPALPPDVTADDLTDWDRMCAIVADSEPLWSPGARHGYHAWTYGWLVGEVIRRVTGRTVGQVLADEVAGPLGVRDELFLGVPDDQLDRVARLEERDWSAAMAMMAAHVPNLDRVLPPGVRTDAALANRRDVRRADIPAVGTLSARAMARMYAALLGAVDGVRLVSPARLGEISTVQVRGADWVFGQESALTLGYAVETDGAMFGWSGAGGSLAGAAPGLGLSIAVTTNVLAFSPDEDTMEDLRSFILNGVASIIDPSVA
ncbi:serine hydrolase domain-containing protein [Micromonospora sp. CPCC 206060]